MSAINLDYNYLFERFEISPESKTGLKWKPRVENNKTDVAWNNKYAGKDCGHMTIDKGAREYYVSSISKNRKVFNHKVVYSLHHKKDLNGSVVIFHIDGNTRNNSPENLKESDGSEHYYTKSKLHKNNKSGQPGVHFCVEKQKYISQITHKLKKIRIGSYETEEEAIQARKEFEKNLYGK